MAALGVLTLLLWELGVRGRFTHSLRHTLAADKQQRDNTGEAAG